jgi:hypothetical protein
MKNKQNVGFFSVAPNHTGDLGELQAAALKATANAIVITNQIGGHNVAMGIELC